MVIEQFSVFLGSPSYLLLAFIAVHNCVACQRAISIPAHRADQGFVCCANSKTAAVLQTAGAKRDNALSQAFEFIHYAQCLQCSVTRCCSLNACFPYELEAALCGDFWLFAAGGGARWSVPLERLTGALKD